MRKLYERTAQVRKVVHIVSPLEVDSGETTPKCQISLAVVEFRLLTGC